MRVKITGRFTLTTVFFIVVSMASAIEDSFFSCNGAIGSMECKKPPDGETIRSNDVSYSDIQYFTCVTNDYAKWRSLGNFTCPESSSGKCLMPCSVEILGAYGVFSPIASDADLVSTLCVCQTGEKSGAITPSQTSLENWCHSPARIATGGSKCSWYESCFIKGHSSCINPDIEDAAALGTNLCALTEQNYLTLSESTLFWIAEADTCFTTNLALSLRDFLQPQACDISHPILSAIVNSKCFPYELGCDKLPNVADLHVLINHTIANWETSSTTFIRRIFQGGEKCHGRAFSSAEIQLSKIKLTVKGQKPDLTTIVAATEDVPTQVAKEFATAMKWPDYGVAWFALDLNMSGIVTEENNIAQFPVTIMVNLQSWNLGVNSLSHFKFLNSTLALVECFVGESECVGLPIMSTTPEPVTTTEVNPDETTNLYSPDQWDWSQPAVISTKAYQVTAILNMYGQPVLFYATGDVVGLGPAFRRVLWRARLRPPTDGSISEDQFDIYHAVYDIKADLVYLTLNELDNAGIFWMRCSDFDMPKVGDEINSADIMYLVGKTTNALGQERRTAGLAMDVEQRLLFVCDYENKEINVWEIKSKSAYDLYTPSASFQTAITAKDVPLGVESFYPSFCAFTNNSGVGNLLAVTDPYNNATYIFQNTGPMLWQGTTTVTKLNVTRPRAPFSSRRPLDLTFDKKGYLYVADYNNYRIQVFQIMASADNKTVTVRSVWSSPQLSEKPIRVGVFTSPIQGKIALMAQLGAEDLIYFGNPLDD